MFPMAIALAVSASQVEPYYIAAPASCHRYLAGSLEVSPEPGDIGAMTNITAGLIPWGYTVHPQ